MLAWETSLRGSSVPQTIPWTWIPGQTPADRAAGDRPHRGQRTAELVPTLMPENLSQNFLGFVRWDPPEIVAPRNSPSVTVNRDRGSRRGQAQKGRRSVAGRLDGQARGQGCSWKVSGPGCIRMGVVGSGGQMQGAGWWMGFPLTRQASALPYQGQQ